MDRPWKPLRSQLLAAAGKTVPDLLGADLRVLFVGINPGLYSAAVGHHFARPGNRFWPALFAGGFTPRLLSAFEERELLASRFGITNLVDRGTARADELSAEEIRAGAKVLAEKVRRLKPRIVAVLGLGAYRDAFGRPGAGIGPQRELLESAQLWVLPNPSGLNAHYQPPQLATLFRQLHRAAQKS
jgi:TDG/mug DNA glycosylase family protein